MISGIQFTARQPSLNRFTIIVRSYGILDESRSIIQAERVDHAAASGRRLADRADIDTASAAQQIVRGAGTEAIFLHEGPVGSPKIGLSLWIGDGASSMRTAKRAGA